MCDCEGTIMPALYPGDEICITYDCGMDISDAEHLFIEVRRPDGETEFWPAELDSDNEQHIYVTKVPEDLISGIYNCRASVQLDGQEGLGTWVSTSIEVLHSPWIEGTPIAEAGIFEEASPEAPVKAFNIDGLIRRVRV